MRVVVDLEGEPVRGDGLGSVHGLDIGNLQCYFESL